MIEICAVGGYLEVGRNMTVIEYKNDIFVVDAGFSFKDESAPGIDYILPNTKYHLYSILQIDAFA